MANDFGRVILRAMIGKYFWFNDELRPVAEAVVPADDINFAYGFGVYETLKVRKGVLFFKDLHVDRLLHSARVIGLEHPHQMADLSHALEELCRINSLDDANIKMLLIGAERAENSSLYIMPLAPFFPPRTSYRDGVHTISFQGERPFPEAKSLSMLTSTIAFRSARRAGAYDALLVDRDGFVREGTRTNLFYCDVASKKLIYTPPRSTVLDGVTRKTVIEALSEDGIAVVERSLHYRELSKFCGLFLTSTSSKIIPIASVDSHQVPGSTLTRRALKVYNDYLERYRESLDNSAR